MFPVLIQSSDDNSMLEMERVHGVPVSRLFLSRQLTAHHVTHILNSLHRLHSQPWQANAADNVYVNYAAKLLQRRKQHASAYNALDSQAFNDTFEQVVGDLKKYESEDSAVKVGMIHGDPVFTNILFNQFGKIKLIDMRGRLGDELSVQGDALYDYAKVYQSLCGYDEVLSDTATVDQAYRSSLQAVFWEHFHARVPGGEKARANLLVVTKSLILSLIPLHDAHRAQSFFRLLDNIH
jgi:aminoglycoside phosphotransferase